ncbi:MFS transporter [Paenibacillus glycinis]|uniref:MFS transporter n=1 Tax=Paenibacillus glycinis TaxID=2697035 RepID=A0ABW9XZ32_9BACL|nr:MFS transporter [Paenibacillus glycinis]NBD27975.1 MFS transporter [Paenibacillus glycinis]
MEQTTGAAGSLWANRAFTRMFAAYAGAAMGEWFDAIAIQVLIVYRWGAGPMTLAWIPVVMALPGLLLGTLAGVAADRLPRIKLMLLCDLLTAAITAALLAAPNVYALMPLLALRAGAAAFISPAQQAITRQIVPTDRLLQATTYNGMVQQGAKIAGPLAGALVLAALSPSACILVHAASRLLSAGLLWTVRSAEAPVPFQPAAGAAATRPSGAIEAAATRPSEAIEAMQSPAERARPSAAEEWRAGMRFIMRAKPVRHTLLFGFVGLTAILMVDYQFSTLLRELAPGEPSLLGWLVAAIGAGSVAVMLLLNKRSRLSYGWGLGGGYVWLGAAIAGLGMLRPGAPIGWVLALGLLLGVGNGVFITTKIYLLQREMPPAMIGRVFGVEQTLTSLVMLGAPLAGGWMIEKAGAGPVFTGFGWATAAIGLLGLLFARALWGRRPAAGDERRTASHTM